MRSVEFKCPKCGGSKIEEVMGDVTVATEITSLTASDDGSVEIGRCEQTNEDGHVLRYQCECGFTIVDDNSPHADEGLDEHALVQAIDALNSPPQKGDMVSFGEIVRRIADGYEELGGEELAEVWNGMYPGMEIMYEGDSLFWVRQDQDQKTPTDVPSCRYCFEVGKQVGARYRVNEVHAHGVVVQDACILCAKKKLAAGHEVVVHPAAAEWATMDDIR